MGGSLWQASDRLDEGEVSPWHFALSLNTRASPSISKQAGGHSLAQFGTDALIAVGGGLNKC